MFDVSPVSSVEQQDLYRKLLKVSISVIQFLLYSTLSLVILTNIILELICQ